MATLKKNTVDTEAPENVVDEEFTEKETQDNLKLKENDFIAGMLAAAEDRTKITKEIPIIRDGKKYFSFHVHALSDEESRQCRKKYTKYDSVDQAKFRSSLIYHATTDEDRENLWDNKRLKDGLIAQGFQIINALDVIEAVLNGGEKDRVIDVINELSGFDPEDAEEVDAEREATAKN